MYEYADANISPFCRIVERANLEPASSPPRAAATPATPPSPPAAPPAAPLTPTGSLSDITADLNASTPPR